MVPKHKGFGKSNIPNPKSTTDVFLYLHRTLGNHAIQRVLKSEAGRLDHAKIAIRPKLKISNASDPFEQEADRVAEQVMQMSSEDTIPATVKTNGEEMLERKCSKCQNEEDEEESVQVKINRKPSSDGDSLYVGADEITNIISNGGRSLDASILRYMGSRFGYDFADVKIHTGEIANKSSQTINALAYTISNNIVFREGQYRPNTLEGRRLLAHELTHVVQQARAGVFSESSKILRQADAGVSDAGLTDAGVTGQTRQHEGVTVSDDPNYTYELLKRIYTYNGFDEMQRFVGSFRNDVVLPRRPIAGVTDDPELSRDESILATLQAQFEKLSKEVDDFTANFEKEARSVTNEFLNENENHVLAEAHRYGVSNLRVEFSWWGWPEIAGDVAENASTRGLAIAAQGLLHRKRKAIHAYEDYKKYIGGNVLGEIARDRWYGWESKAVEKLDLVTHTKRDLDVYRVQVETRFPILAALSSDQDFKWQELEDLAKGSEGKNASATKVIIDQIVEKFSNIQKVREELEPGGDVNIWLTPEIREPLRETLNATPGTFYGRIVDDKISDEEPSAITKILIGLLQLGLVLLAPATGGLTLIPAAAISVATAYEHFKEYQLKKAMRGTDFGAAALSAEDPSLFWLAVDIVGAGFDVAAAGGVAFRLFRQLAPAARAVSRAQAGEEVVLTLERNAAELGGEALARRVGDSARKLQRGAGREIGITAEETRQFERAASEIADRELREGREFVQTAETLAGREVSVSRSGWIFSCSSPCVMVRERYKDLLAREPRFARRLNELEGRARSLPTGPEGNVARKQIANEAAALEREMQTAALLGERGGAVIGRVSRAEFGVTTNAPIDWPIVRIDPKHPPDVVPDGVVLEFPTGERVWRSVGSDRGIVIESQLGAPAARKKFEAEYFSKGEMELPGYVKSDLERAHSQGAGTGFESRYAIPYAPREVNQIYQNLGIEEFLRILQSNKPEGVVFGLLTNTRVHPGTRRLSLIEYTITASYRGQRRTLFSTGIRVEGTLDKPVASIARDLTSVNPEAFELLPLNDLAETMLERRLQMMARKVRRSR